VIATCAPSTPISVQPTGSKADEQGQARTAHVHTIPDLTAQALVLAPSCAEEFTPANLRQRTIALDGVIVATPATSPDRFVNPIRVRVLHWFTADLGEVFTIGMQWDGDTADTMGEFGPPYHVGTHLLISGEPRHGTDPTVDPIAWVCGFTQEWTPQNEAFWKAAFG